jgi:hypothetical protein
MVRDFFSLLRRRITGPEPELARAWQIQMAGRLGRDEREEREHFERTMRADPGIGRVILGRAHGLDGDPFWVGMPVEQFLSSHGWVTGSTGSGKTYFVLALLMQVLTTGKHPVVLFDMKGEFAALLLDIVVPALVASGGSNGLLDNLRIVRPFDRMFVPELRITLPEIGIESGVQAYMIADALVEGLGADLGPRMSRISHKLVSLAIERNEPLTTVQEWLEQPERFRRCARTSRDPTIRRYATGAFFRENRSSLDALLARLDEFLFLPSTRAALSAERCLSFPESLEAGLTVVDLGNPPAGAERVARFWGGVLIGRLMRAVLSRPVHDSSPRAWIVLEEFQEALATRQAEQFGRLLALSRHKRAVLTFINQLPGQLDPNLVRMLRTNTAIEAIFRCNIDDARAVGHALPVRRGEPRLDLLEDLVRLATRDLYLWLKDMLFRAMRIRSPRLDIAALRGIGSHVSTDDAARILQGIAATRIVEANDDIVTPDDNMAMDDGGDGWQFDEEGPDDDPVVPFLG